MHVCSVMADSLQPHGLQPTRLPSPGNFTGKNTGVGCHFLHQGVFPTQGLDLSLPHCRWRLYCWAIRVAFVFSCNYKVLDCKPFKITVLADLYTLKFLLESWKLENDVCWSQIHYLEKTCFLATAIAIGKSHVLLEYVTVPVWEMQGNEDVFSKKPNDVDPGLREI